MHYYNGNPGRTLSPRLSKKITTKIPAARTEGNEIEDVPQSVSRENIVTALKRIAGFKKIFKADQQPNVDDLLMRLGMPLAGKTSFLVFKHNKYITVATENIAYFYVRHESTIIVRFDRQEYFVNHPLEHIQNLLTERQFFRLNRQYLVNFNAIKEVEHYLARKLLVNLAVPVSEKLLVPKEKVSSFLHWLDNR